MTDPESTSATRLPQSYTQEWWRSMASLDEQAADLARQLTDARERYAAGTIELDEFERVAARVVREQDTLARQHEAEIADYDDDDRAPVTPYHGPATAPIFPPSDRFVRIAHDAATPEA